MSSVDITRQTPADLATSAGLGVEAAGGPPRPRGYWRRLRADRLAMTGAVAIALLGVAALAAPVIVDVVGAPAPDRQSSATLDEFGTPTGPSAEHVFGVDHLGRDVFSRVLYGLRVSLIVALVATGLAVAVGVALGLVAGYFRGWLDTVLARLMDVQLAFPILLLAIGLASACSLGDGCVGGLIEPGLTTVIVVIGLAAWPYIGRIVRGEALALRESQFVEAARSVGASGPRILLREVLPNLVAPIVVYATLLVPASILFEAALSFLGIGVEPPQPSLGQMISEAVPIFDVAWWYMLFPGAALLLLVLSFNLVGDGVRDALDPRTAR